MKRKWKMLLCLLMAVTLVITACGSSGGAEAPAESSDSADPDSSGGEEKNFAGVTIEYASCYNESEPAATWLKEQAEQWEAETGGTVNFNFAGRDVLTSVKSDILIGDAPDIIDDDVSEIAAALITDDEILVEPLDDLYERTAPGDDDPIGDYFSEAYNLYAKDGTTYVVPFIFVTSGFFYNKTLFSDLNLEVPGTWDEFLAVCDAIEASGIPALAADGNISFYNCYYFQNLCQRILGTGAFCEAALDETGESWGDPGFLEAAQKVSQLSAAGSNYFQDGYAGSAYPAAQSDWAMGGAGMIYCGSWIPLETGDLVDGDFEYGFFPFPDIEGGKGSTTDIEAHLLGFCVPKDGKNKEAAKDFIVFCSSKASADRLVELSDNMSARTDAIYPDALSDVKPTVDAATGYRKNYDGAMAAAPEWWANVFYPADDELFFGNLTPEQFIEQMKSESAKFYANKQ